MSVSSVLGRREFPHANDRGFMKALYYGSAGGTSAWKPEPARTYKEVWKGHNKRTTMNSSIGAQNACRDTGACIGVRLQGEEVRIAEEPEANGPCTPKRLTRRRQTKRPMTGVFSARNDYVASQIQSEYRLRQKVAWGNTHEHT